MIRNIINFLFGSNPVVKPFPSGLEVDKVKAYLERTSHCGQYWGCKATYNPLSNTVNISMRGNESYSINMETGEGMYEDNDGMGCDNNRSCNFILTKEYKRVRKR